MNHLTIGVVVPTYNSKNHLVHSLTPFLQSPLKPRILVIDSSSTDGTLDLAKSLGAETLTIPQSEFNHGLTREKARKHLNTDIIVMITDDAYAINHHVLEKLISPIITGKASLSYARQIPRHSASFFEAFPRRFNYPEQSHVRSLKDAPIYGAYTFFCSNSCAAYSNKALDQIGGFKSVLFGEDTLAAAELLHAGHKIAYVAEAEIKHSHSYTLLQDFKRCFDIGFSRKENGHLFEYGGSATKRGASYFKEMLKELLKTKPHLIPFAILNTAFKWIGYRLGKSSQRHSWLNKHLSSQKFYWK